MQLSRLQVTRFQVLPHMMVPMLSVQDFKVPETSLVDQGPRTSGKPQCKIVLIRMKK